MKMTKKLVQDSHYIGWDLNQVPSEHKSKALLLHWPLWYEIITLLLIRLFNDVE
jgi:hypothetical protein